jgi:hypothetical protein
MKTLITLVISILLLSGCQPSFVGTALKSMTVTKADSYFNLDDKQENELRKEVDKDFSHAKTKVLPEIASSLRAMNKELEPEKVKSVRLIQISTNLESSIKKVTACFSPSAQKLAASLSEEQFQYFYKKMNRDFEESEQQTKSSQRALEKAVTFYADGITSWVGPLTSEQEKELKKFLRINPYPWALQNQSRKKLADQLMNKRRNPQDLEKFVSSLLGDYESFRTAEFQTAIEQHRSALKKFLFEELWPELTPTQKSTFKTNLTAKAEMLEDLSRRN